MILPKYTFLLPAYKPNFLEEALESIKNQTYPDFKVIVSDDCSPYELKPIFDKVCTGDSRFTFRRNEKNMGGKSLVSHWNLLVDMCDTEFFIMASDDDVYMPDFLQEADLLLTKYPKACLLRGRSMEIDEHNQKRTEESVMPEFLDQIHFIHRIYQKDWVGGIASFVYRTEYLKQQGKFVDFPSAWFSDDVTNFLMATNGCCITPKVVFKVRNSSVNISGQWGNPADSCKKMEATYMNYDWMRTFMQRFSSYPDRQFVLAVNKEYKYKIYTNVQSYIYSCHIRDFLRFLWICPNDLGLSKPRMLAHYMRNKLSI